MRIGLVAGALVFVFVNSLSAQWLNYPTPGIPRLPDGKPNLSAPVPRNGDGMPDLSGLWRTEGQGDDRLLWDLAKNVPTSDVEMTPWAAAIQRQRESRDHVDDPVGYCLPHGVPRILFTDGGFKILQTPSITAFLIETGALSTFRQVFTDGRTLPDSPEPTWLGYSVARWDADTFVIETNGFRDAGWLDTNKGRPHSDALHVTERYRRTDFGHMELILTISDFKAYRSPWTVKTGFLLRADSELLESFCENHEKSMEHRRIAPAPLEPESPRVP